LRSTEENETHVWNPFFVIFDDEPPDAAHDVDIHEHDEDEVCYFISCLNF
jgi:hypothetical protein